MPENKVIDLDIKNEGGLLDDGPLADIIKLDISVGSFFLATAGLFIANFVGIEPLTNWLSAKQNEIAPTKLTPAENLFTLRARQWIDDDNFYPRVAEHGFAPPRADAIVESMQAVMGLEEVLELYNRGGFGKVGDSEASDAAKKRIQSLGYSFQDAIRLFDLHERLPSVQDVVRFAVREAFNDSVAERFELDSEFPEEFAIEAERRGLSEEDAKRFWRSHWDLPSPSQAFEMFHRLAPDTLIGLGDSLRDLGIEPTVVETSLDDVKTLLKTQDYSPAWRDRLLALSKTPLSRVDLRRLYGAGLITKERVFFGYRDLGYAPSDAQILADFAIHDATEEERGLTRTQVLKLFKSGVLSQEQASGFLFDLGFSEEAVNLSLLTAIMEFEAEELDFKVDALIQRFRIGEFDDTQLGVQLTGLLPTAAEANAILAKERARIHNKLKLPTRSNLSGWLKKGLIDSEEFKTRMVELGYREKDIIIYAKEAKEPKKNEESA